ncbi:MAG: endonuclease/exonuclease/phosphatase family protein [Bacteroidota bacterium]
MACPFCGCTTEVVRFEAVSASPKDTLRVMSYNVFDGPRDPEGVAGTIRFHDPDLVALQEVTEEGARFLAQTLGFGGVFFRQEKDLRRGRRFINGKALLSRFPLLEPYHHSFSIDPAERARACDRRGDYGELNEDRGILGAELLLGKRRLEILNVHFALGDPFINQENLLQLHAFAHALRIRGFELVLLGDFNSHFGLLTEEAQRLYLETYGRSPGSIVHPCLRTSVRALLEEFPSVWEKAPTRTVLLGKEELPPEEARERLSRCEPGSDCWHRWLDAADGNTHQGAHKRFDNILTLLPVEWARLDLESRASDHSPLVAQLTFHRHQPIAREE